METLTDRAACRAGCGKLAASHGGTRGLCNGCYRRPEVRGRYPAGTTTLVAVCRHCRVKGVNRPRGLCWTCYYAPGVKELYPAGSDARLTRPECAAHGTRTVRRGPPLFPTRTPPGSPARRVVYWWRLQCGFDLHHPDDAKRKGG